MSNEHTLEERARKEAEERYPDEARHKNTWKNMVKYTFVRKRERTAYAAGLIAARKQDAEQIAALRAEVEALKSKPQPTVEGLVKLFFEWNNDDTDDETLRTRLTKYLKRSQSEK